MKTVTPSLDLAAIDQQILKYWEEKNCFQKSLDLRAKAPRYSFYDGPPFSSGLPHYGHVLPGTLKDIIPRYQTMKGFYVERRFGWDTHGLPIEMIIEKELNLGGRKKILEYGVAKFNEACRAGVLRCVQDWEVFTKRSGRWVDFENDYKTMDLDFMESTWWVFKQLWDKGRIYLSSRVMPFSWRLSTPLSNFEASSNYKDVQDPAITVRFKLLERPGVSILAWTTTPWTLPSNLGVCVGPDIDYALIEAGGEKLILAKDRLPAYFKTPEDYNLLEEFKGSTLAGLHYQPLFDFYADLKDSGAFRVLVDDYVSTADGTGIVHQSPAHGEDDHRVGQKNGIPLVDPVDEEGNFTDKVPLVQGLNIKEADKLLIAALKEKGLLYRHDTLSHSYPFCERSDTPLIYKAISAWYVKVEDLREEMTANNQKVNWVPDHIKDGRFGNWLANARDWNISRNRFWGNPLPVWICENCGQQECLGSRAELEAKTGQTVKDLHKHFVDELHWKCSSCQGQMTRTPEVLDCWFESGSMPYAQQHYPFENKEQFEKSFPADFIAEGLDQTRGWFYTLMILGTALFENSPFKNVVVNGMILAEDGRKMSKRLKNYPDPMKVIDTYGADALRLYLINSGAVRGEALRFSEAGVKEIVRSVFLPYWNVYSFFTTYANVDNYKPRFPLTQSENILDRWIISRLQTLLAKVEQELSVYKLYAVVPALLEFIEELTNWYLRRSRRRFWDDDIADKQSGYDTLYFVLLEFTKTLAPFLPFITETIFQNLATLLPEAPESVHHADYPVADQKLIDAQLEERMALIQRTVGLGRSLRARLNIRVRQPLQSITVVTRNVSDADTLKDFAEHIQAELNVKEVLFDSREEQLVAISVKPNFPVLGPIFGKDMGALGKELSKLSREQIASLENGQSLTIMGKELTPETLQIIRKPIAKDLEIETAAGVTVFFDLQLSEALTQEGLAREFINRVQRMRKDADFHISDRISIVYQAHPLLDPAVKAFEDFICSETLGVKLESVANLAVDSSYFQAPQEIESASITMAIKRG